MFRLPVFNIHCDVYARLPSGLPGALQISNLPCQLYDNATLVAKVLRYPKGTDIRMGGQNAGGGHVINCPSGSNNWYQTATTFQCHRGFDNEYWATLLNRIDPPSTYPSN